MATLIVRGRPAGETTGLRFTGPSVLGNKPHKPCGNMELDHQGKAWLSYNVQDGPKLEKSKFEFSGRNRLETSRMPARYINDIFFETIVIDS